MSIIFKENNMAISEDLQGVHAALENMSAHIAPQRLTEDEWAFLRLLQENLLSLAEQAWSLEQSLSPCVPGTE